MKIRTPGKLILSGEHSVVYGKPALSVAINRFVESIIKPHDLGFLFECEALHYRAQTTRKDLIQIKKLAMQHYTEFQEHRRPIEKVLAQATDLIQIATITALEQCQQNNTTLKINISSSIPLGHGLGSSAAAIVNVLFGLTSYFKKTIDSQALCQQAITIENLQHGTSSGLDITTCFHGGCIFFQNKQYRQCTAPELSLFIINSGKPSSSTGACVSHVSTHKNDNALWNAFEAVTVALDSAIKNNDVTAIKNCIQENHRLLCRIGVVPERLQKFINTLNAIGIPAKISGAGAITGEYGGTVLAFTNDAEALEKITKEYHYSFQKITCNNQGTHIV